MSGHHQRPGLGVIVAVVATLALVTAVALAAGSGKAAAADPVPGTSPFEGVDNVILFIGDGMAFDHLEVGRQLDGGS